MDNTKRVTKDFLDEPLRYADVDYFSELRKFHDSVAHRYGIKGNPNIKGEWEEYQEKLKELRPKMNEFRDSLRDETTKRLYRLFTKLAEIGKEEIPLIELVADGITEWWNPLTKHDVDGMFFIGGGCFYWREMDIWTEEYGQNSRPYPYGYPENEERVEITLYSGDGSYDCESANLYFYLPLCWLSEKFINDPLSDKRFGILPYTAAIEGKYRKLFGDRTFGEKETIVHLIAEHGLTETIENLGLEDREEN